ncbi:MAG: hypothetical protein ABGW78_10455, partial [Pirellulales bacterium]
MLNKEALRRAGDLRPPRRDALGRACCPGAGCDGRDGAAWSPRQPRRADPAGAADRAAAGPGAHHQGGRRRAVPEPQDGGVPPATRLPEARHQLPRRA